VRRGYGGGEAWVVSGGRGVGGRGRGVLEGGEQERGTGEGLGVWEWGGGGGLSWVTHPEFSREGVSERETERKLLVTMGNTKSVR